MAAYNKIGFLAANIGQGWADFNGKRFGLGDYVRMLDEAGIPIAMACNDGTMGIGDVLGRIENGSKVPHVLGYRIVAYDNKPVEYHSVPNYLQEPKVAAKNHYNLLLPIIEKKRDLPKYRKHLWWFPINEVRAKRAVANGVKEPQWGDMHAWDWMGEFCYEFALLANAEGYKVAMPQANSGEPQVRDFDGIDAWKQPGMKKFLQLCADRPDQVCVGLHEYSWELDDIMAGGGSKVGRFEYLFRACDEMGIARPNVIFGEWGWKHDRVPRANVALAHIRQIAELYAKHPQILGAFIWYLGPYNHSDQVNKLTAKLLKPLAEATLQWRFPDPAKNGPLTIPTSTPPYEGRGQQEEKEENEEKEEGRVDNGHQEGAEVFEETVQETVFDFKFASKSHEDAAGGWTDLMREGERLPIQVPNGWQFEYVAGENKVGDPDYDWGMPEALFRWTAHLPPHEHDFLLNDLGHTYKVFAAHRPIWSKLSRPLTLKSGKYKVSFAFFVDPFTDYDRERHAKIKPPDPLTADSRITLAGQSTDWTLNTFLEENVVELEVSVDKETETELVLENRGRWAVKNNGVFLHRIHFEKLTTRVVSRSTKPGGSTSKGMTEVRGGTAVLQQSIQPIQAEVNALQVEVEQKGEAQWQQKQLFTIPFSGQNSRINLTFLKEATVKMVEEETRKGGVVKPKSAKKWPFAVLKAKDVKTAVPELKPLGTDVYFGTGDHINWAELKKNGVEFTFLRVGSGVTEQDGNYERNVRLCLENDIPFGNYFFLYEKGFVTAKTKRKAIDARAQARRFAEQSDWRSTLPPVVDVERHNLTVAEIKAFVDEFHQLVDAPPIMIYTRANLWNKLVPKAATWPQKHPLWVAHYGTDTPSLPHHWDRCLFHQFSETQRFQGHPNNLDGNVFFGKAEELKLGKETAVVPHAERGEGMEEKEEKIADNPLDKLETRHADMTLLDVAHVTQRENGLWKDCGPACIAMLTGIPLVKALKQSKQQKNKALGFGHLIIALEANEVTAKRVENLRAERVRRFVKQGKPVILLINYHQMPKIKQQLGRSFNSKTKKWNTEFDHFVVAVGADDKGIYIHDPLGFASDKRPGGGYFTFLTDSDLHKTMSSMSWAGNPTYKGLLIDKKFRQLLANDLTSCYVHQDYVKLKGGLAVTIGSPKMRSEPREEPTTYMQKAIRQNRAVLLLKKEVENGYLAIRTAVKGIWPATKTNKIDMTRYFFPPNDEPMGEIYLLKNSWNGGQERVQLQRQGDVSYVVKNAKYEKRAIRNGKIYLEVDTSPGTDASGQDRYYTVDSETGWMPQKMAVGERFMRREMVTYYHKHNGHQITQNHAKSDLLFVKHHDSWTSHGDRTLNDVVELAWEVIKGDGSTYIDERYFFAAGYGLVGWEKHSGEKSWITNENTAGQSNNKMEQISFL